MTDADDSGKKTYIVEFDGEKKTYPKWKVQFSAAARMNGYWELLKGSATAPADNVNIDETTDAGKAQMKLRKAHEKGYANLVLAMTKDTALNVVTLATSTRHPDGDLKMAWDKLEAKFQPADDASKMVLRNNFLAMTLTDVNTNPSEWIAEVET